MTGFLYEINIELNCVKPGICIDHPRFALVGFYLIQGGVVMDGLFVVCFE